MTERPMTERSAHPRVLPLLVERWSPRAFDGSEMPAEDLAVIFEGAGLAPSAFNLQPWRFVYAKRGDANWERFLSLLIPFNAMWAKDASVLVFIISDTVDAAGDGTSHSHSFDAGAAWAQLALQATALGYHAHGMTGVDFAKARAELGVPERYRIEAAAALRPKSYLKACATRKSPAVASW